jgi:FKBP-type peptidyl-prolyl cis-trans isomerase FkpA
MNKLSALLIGLLTATSACFAWQQTNTFLPRVLGRHHLPHYCKAIFLSTPLHLADDSATVTSADPFDSYQPGQATMAMKDIATGEGEGAKAGDVLTVSMSGKLYPDGAKDFVKISKFSFELGEGKTMPGFDTGLVGIRQGGTRKLRVPPSLAFGAAGSSEGRVPPNADLEYNVEVLAIATSDFDKTIAKIGVDRLGWGAVVLALFVFSSLLPA